MRGSLMRLWTHEQHTAILTKHTCNVQAAAVYSEDKGVPITRQNVRYWRRIFIDNEGVMARADRELRNQRKFIKPLPDDDLGDYIHIPERADRILIVPDIHAPYHHPDTIAFLRAVRGVLNPDLVVNLGDELDKHAMSFHDSDPNLDSAGKELEASKPLLEELHELFPEMLICHSNHSSMLWRKAKAHGIPVQYLKKYREVLFPEHGAPGWSWAYGWRVNTSKGVVMFKHQVTGDSLQDAAHNQCSLVTGHQHGDFDIRYAASSAHLYFAMRSGCLIDKDSMAFAYGMHTRYKPIIGCSAIIDGVPQLIPMLLDDSGRWVGRLK